ncbi:MAG: hypothetical protein ABW131_16390, partial [Candidatus Sedimenticola sp. 6PFRAG5]
FGRRIDSCRYLQPSSPFDLIGISDDTAAEETLKEKRFLSQPTKRLRGLPGNHPTADIRTT